MLQSFCLTTKQKGIICSPWPWQSRVGVMGLTCSKGWICLRHEESTKGVKARSVFKHWDGRLRDPHCCFQNKGGTCLSGVLRAT